MEKTCKDCRFFNSNSCSKFSVSVDENYKVCHDFADRVKLTEEFHKIPLND